MSAAARTPLLAFAARYLARLRFPYLFALTAALLAIDLLVPDPAPFVDELLLASGTVLFGVWRKRRRAPDADPSAA